MRYLVPLYRCNCKTCVQCCAGLQEERKMAKSSSKSSKTGVVCCAGLQEASEMAEPPSRSRVEESSRKKGTVVAKIVNHLARKGSSEENKLGKRNTTDGEGGKGSELEDDRKKEQKNKKQRMVDPCTVPPNKINVDLFKMRNPFLNVLTSHEVPRCEEDKVMDGQRMAPDALLAAMAAMVPTSIDFARSFPQASSELGGRPIHLSIASGFKKLTRPRSYPKLPSREALKTMWQSCMAAASISSATEEEDLNINIEQEVSDVPGFESDESLVVQHEGDGGEMRKNEARFDICFMVYDKHIMGFDKKVTKLIVDCKWQDVSIEAICQVATHGLKDAASNMEKGRYSPIYLEVWGETAWRYAILFPEGIVSVEDKEVKASLEPGSKSKGLQDILSTKQAHMQKEYPDAVYPDGNYILGSLFISMKKFAFPNFMGSGYGNKNTELFYQSKIRMIVGDRALEWSKANVDEILACREEQLRKLTEDFLM